jgi:hypothetical protein
MKPEIVCNWDWGGGREMRCIQLIREKFKVASAGWRPGLVVVGGILLSSCAFVDAYGPRIYQNNLTFMDANSQETLLNIVRASRHEALSFIGIGSESGSQTESLGVGLPTFTFGPAQTAAQRTFGVGPNSTTSTAMGSYQVQPLVTTNFMQGMLTPISPKTLALLLNTYPRPWVFSAVLEGVKMKGNVGKRPLFFYFHNDPADDQYESVATNEKCRALVEHAPYDAAIYNDSNQCNFSKFQEALQTALDYGLSSELVVAGSNDQNKGNGGNQCCCCGTQPSASQKSTTPPNANAGTNGPGAPQTASASANATSTPSSTGRLCWDPNLAQPRNQDDVNLMGNVCGQDGGQFTLGSTSKNKPVANNTFTFTNGVTFSSIQFVFRSPYGVYKYLGQLLREQSAARVRFVGLRSLEERELASGPFLNITKGASADCLVAAFYNGESFCVPRQGSNSTAVMLDVLGQLKNLSITPTDLNAATAVRLID